ncbi:MAG: selenocysteine-specific translation elongation factor [Oscillospiraceae bacterium]|nr:selenocysteine-specific translation elongation factor [Oscillospiraceae bacterium]
MKHIIIGTAGHVDHGKTTLIKALTGIDTDRLEEEKRRGLTIELGFAHLDFDGGVRVGIIDVPGHERFIRNMLAGSGGIDIAMLVIAADEGIMPQTREHLDILTLLGVKDGIVVLTKTDKADPDWLSLVYEETAEFTKGTFMENKPVVPVSAQAGTGIDELKQELFKLISKAGEKDISLPFRLPADRVFSVDGFGTVVTGTLIEGTVKTGDRAEILPAGKTAQVRNIQVHGENVGAAYAGQRTAISLGGIKSGEIERGDVISAPKTVNVISSIDVRINLLPGTKRAVKNADKLHIYHQARTVVAKAYLIDKSKPGDDDGGHARSKLADGGCYARLKLDEPLPCKRGDRFIMRFYSPGETIGGGIILNTAPPKRISRTRAAIDALHIREHGSAEDIVSLSAYELAGVFTSSEICKYADIDAQSADNVLEFLVCGKKLIRLSPDRYICEQVMKDLDKKSKEILTDYHEANPLRVGISAAELCQKLMPTAKASDGAAVLGILRERGVISLFENLAAMPGFEPKLTDAQAELKAKLMSALQSAGYNVQTIAELSDEIAKNQERDFKQVFESLKSKGEIIMLGEQIFWPRGTYERAIGVLRGHFDKNDMLTLAECRDLLGTSRKYALAFLEYLDGKQVTRMRGDVRILAKGFDA